MIDFDLSGGFLGLASSIAFVLISIALILSFIRIVIGPSLADRVIALDLLAVLAMGFIGLRVLTTGQTLYLEIAIALGLVAFVATVFFARLVAARADPTSGVEEERVPRGGGSA